MVSVVNYMKNEKKEKTALCKGKTYERKYV